MPNVAGVQFPYTPQGEQAAQLYQRSLSPGPGLGFRPLGSRTESNPIIAAANQQIAQNMRRPIRMHEGGSVEGRAVADELRALTDDKTTPTQEVVDYVTNNLRLLTEIAEEQPWVQRVIDGVSAHVAGRDTESEFAAHLADFGSAMAAPTALAATGLGRQKALRAMGDTRPSDQDSSLGPVFHGDFTGEEEAYWNRARRATEARGQAGTGLPPYLGVPPSSEQFDDTIGVFNQSEDWLKPFSRRQFTPSPPPEPWEFEGMAHGGVPRGTVAGELEPRGYLTARQAGETMRERAKGLRGRRNYGGGIGSLYNRYG